MSEPDSQDDFRNPALAVDAVVLRTHEKRTEIMLIRRAAAPFQGMLALPGGFVDQGESPQSAVLRELREECGIEGSFPTLLDVRGEPGRDPRKHVVSIIYRVQVSADAEPSAGDDASAADWFDLARLLSRAEPKLAFDHLSILADLF